MPERRRPFKDERGAPPLLTEQVEKLLLEATKQAVPLEVAAAYAGIEVTTFKRYCRRGRDAEDKLLAAEEAEESVELTQRETLYYEFWKKIEQARAESVARSVLSVQKGAMGGAVTEETTKKYRDPNTGAVVEERTVKKAPPDWRAAAWMLERGAAGRQFFHKDATQVEITGADGGALQVASVDADALADRVLANLAAARAAAITTAATVAAIEAGKDDDDTVDAVLVETDD